MVVLTAILIFVGPFVSFAQSIYLSDSFPGGVTAGGYAPDNDGSGSGQIMLHFPAGAQVVKAILFAGNFDTPAILPLMLNGHPIRLDAATQMTPGHWSSYGDPASTHAVDVTSLIDPTQETQTLDVPPQPATSHRFVDFWLVVEYTFAGATQTRVTVVLDTQDFASSLRFNIPIARHAVSRRPLAFGAYLGYVCNSNSDGEIVNANNARLGVVGGHEANSGNCAGPMPHFYYERGTLVGLGECGADQAMDTTDVLSDIRGLVRPSDQAVTVTLDHISSATPNDNSVWGLVVVDGDTICTNPTISLSPTFATAKPGYAIDYALMASSPLVDIASLDVDLDLIGDNLELFSVTSANTVTLNRSPLPAHLSLHGAPYLVTTNDTLALLHFDVSVGRDTLTRLHLSHLQIDGIDESLVPCGASLPSATTPDPTFIMTDTCSSAEIRQYLRTGRVIVVSKIVPNPVSNSAVLEVQARAECDASIEIVDVLGNTVARQSSHLHQGTNDLTLDLGNIPSGFYQIVLRTPAEDTRTPLVKID